MTSVIRFEVLQHSHISGARLGRIYTTHGTIDTPAFVGVGTNGTLKGVDPLDSCQDELDLLFCNTYHLMLQPTPEVVEKMGGLHHFIRRNKPIITDSGGFQVFSLAYGGVADELKSKGTKKQDGSVLKIEEEGILFRSYRDGRPIWLTPESSVEAQQKLGADLIVPLDELLPYHADPEYQLRSLDRTHRWALRSLSQHQKNPQHQGMWAVVHGGICPELRKKSAAFLSQHPFSGFAIGGSLGKNKEQLTQVVRDTIPHLPPDAPRHLLGIGDLPSLEACIPLGIDTFDSAYPTKAARHGTLFTQAGPLKIGRGIYQIDPQAIDPGCDCHTCQNYTRAYLHHLFKAHEPAFTLLATRHNIKFMVRWMKNIRESIKHHAI